VFSFVEDRINVARIGRLQNAQPLQTSTLLDVQIVNAPMKNALDWLCRRLDNGTPTRVAFANAHCFNVAARNQTYQDALTTADAVLPDGSGLAMALRMRGETLAENLNGTDFTPALCRRLAASGEAVFLLGGKPGVAQAAAAKLQQLAPGLIVAGVQHGFFRRIDEAAVLRQINLSGARVLLLALGVPAQDIWLQRNMPRLHVTLSMGVGGLFDFLSGRIPRAPVPMRKAGLEWVWRLYQEPSGMWRRYVLGNPAFLARAAIDAAPPRAALADRCDLALKRALDIVGAGFGLIGLAPWLALIALAIRLDSKGPALLRQTRIGKDGVPFTVFKFRSMFNDAEARRAALVADNSHGAEAITFKIKSDPRITRLGRFLRKSSIDELPQLLNVLHGSMSLVGPRPPLPAEVSRYSAHQRRRLIAKPGMTCLWQVSGRANLPFSRQVELDIDYLARRNLFLDLQILARTIPAVLLARGAY